MPQNLKIYNLLPEIYPQLTQYVNGQFYDGNGNLINVNFNSNSGTTGPQGPIGGVGVQGPQGAQGYQGITGQQGYQGTQGTQGYQGITGLQGNQGLQGATGSQGPIGVTGNQGPQGYQGITGSQGSSGSQGPQGATGTNYNFDSAFIITGLTVSLKSIQGGSVIANTNSTTGEPLGSIGYSTAATASTLVERDLNSNIFINNYAGNVNTNASYGGTFSLTSSSGRIQIFSGAIGCSVILPDATTLINGHTFVLNANQSSGYIGVYSNGNNLLFNMPVGAYAKIELITNSFPAGTWDYQFYGPSNVSWGNSGLSMSGNISAGTLQITNIPQTTNNNSILVIDGGGIIYSQTASYLTQSALNNYFINNGNSFGTAATVGTNDNNTLSIESNNQTVATYATSSIIIFQPETYQTSGLTTSIVYGYSLINTSTASSGIVQYSPYLLLQGAGYSSGYPATGSFTASVRMGVQPTSGSAKINFNMDYTLDGSTWTNFIQFNQYTKDFYFMNSGGVLHAAAVAATNGLTLEGSYNSGGASVILQSVNSGGNVNYPSILANVISTVNQTTSTYSVIDFLISRTQTAYSLTATHRLISGQVNSTELFGVDNTGSTFITKPGLTTSIVYGLSLINPSTSSSTVVQYSPYLLFQGSGYNSGTTASFTGSVRMGVQPSGGVAAPKLIYYMDYSLDGSTWNNFIQANTYTNDYYIMNGSALIHASEVEATNSLTLLGNNTGSGNAAVILTTTNGVGNTNKAYVFAAINSSVNQTTSTYSVTDFLINRTQTAYSLTATHRLMSAQVNSSEVFGVDNNGYIYTTTPNLSTSIVYGHSLINPSTASSGLVQYSPYLLLQGSGYSTVATSSFTGSVRMGIQPLSAAAAQVNFNMDYSVNGGSTWTNFFQYNNNNATLYINNGASTIYTTSLISSNVLNLQGSNTIAPGSAVAVYPTATITNTNTTNQTFVVKPTYNQATSSSANNYDLVINRTQTSIGLSGYGTGTTYSAIQRLITGQVNSTEVFGVDNTGSIFVTKPGLSGSINYALNLTNPSTASSTVQQQYSPAIYMQGSIWNGGTTASLTMSVRQYVAPQNTAAGDLQYNIDVSKNGGATWNNALQIYSYQQQVSIFTGVGTFLANTLQSTNNSLTLQGTTYLMSSGNPSIILKNSTTIGNTAYPNVLINVQSTVNQTTSTYSVTDFLISRTQTAYSLTATHRLISGQVNSTELFGVDNKGNVISQTGFLSIGTYSGIYSNGIVIDSTNNNGRLSVGQNANISLYTGGIGATAISTFGATGIGFYQPLNINATYSTTSQGANINISGYNTKGGSNYLDFLVATNTLSGATNPNKWFRVDNTGTFQIVNSLYNSTVFSLTDGGALTLTATSSGAALVVSQIGTTADALIQISPRNTSTWARIGSNGSSLALITGGSDISNSTPAIWMSSANVVNINGQGNTNGSLVIQNTVQSSYSAYAYIALNGTSAPNTGYISSSSGNVYVSVYGYGRLVGTGEIDILSDIRIKNVLGKTNNTEDLETIKKVEITNYKHIDTIKNTDKTYKKVISQQISSIYPDAVSYHKEFIPNIFKMAEIQNNWIKLSTDLEIGDTIKLVLEKEEKKVSVIEITETSFKIDTNIPDGSLFVYGKQVDDFGVVDYDALSMLNISATQEIIKRLEILEKENKELKNKIKF